MFTRIRSGMTFANVISVMALFVALGGTSYAAINLPKNSVTARQIKANAVGASEIKRNAVRSNDVADRSLLAQDFAAGQLPTAATAGVKGEKGDKGEKGEKGDTGPSGPPPSAFARVQANGTLQPDVGGFPSQVKNVDAGDVVKGEAPNATGTYCFGGLGFPVASAQVALDNADAALADRDRIVSVAIDRGEDLGDCPATHNQARVRIMDASGAAQADARFFIWFEE